GARAAAGPVRAAGRATGRPPRERSDLQRWPRAGRHKTRRPPPRLDGRAGGAAPPGPVGSAPPPVPRPDRPEEKGEGGRGTGEGAPPMALSPARAARAARPRGAL